MKIAVITDTHYGFKRGSLIFQEYFEKFYSQIFFPTLKERNIDTIIHMGDVFDHRKTIDYTTLEWAQRVVFEPLKDYKVHMIIGNHDVYYKNTNNINSPELLLKNYSNIIIYNKPFTLIEKDLICDIIPWITVDNEQDILEFIEKSSSNICFGHLELNGFKLNKDMIMDHGKSKNIFEKYNKVFSGHFHTRSTDGRIFYIGNPYQMFSNDVNDERGFIIFDTETLEHEYINNSFELFCNLYYDDDIIVEDDFLNELEEYVENKIVKLIVKNRKDHKKYENFINTISEFNLYDLKIIENYDITFSDNSEIENTSDTLILLHNYIEEVEGEFDKSRIKTLVTEIYKQAYMEN